MKVMVEKIECVLNYFPWELEKAIAEWVDHYNHERYHESR
jgi:transposase InsO family protein